MSRTRRFFSPEDKVAILRKHFLEGVPVSEICKQLDLNPAQFYNWQRELFENGHLAFRTPKQDPKTARLESENAKLRAKLEQKNEVLAKLMGEHVKLKKELGEI
ncbi:MAG: hypothetical protein KatS3mg110_0930 [Pirellulaceae bacterium]|nr:MAG: hypothetical protein KatS3mg110_0930 [Pirellulaceae bacterium]